MSSPALKKAKKLSLTKTPSKYTRLQTDSLTAGNGRPARKPPGMKIILHVFFRVVFIVKQLQQFVTYL